MKRQPRIYTNPVARRIAEGAVAPVEGADKEDLSLRGLGRRAGISPTTPQKVCEAFENLGLDVEQLFLAEEGSDIGLLTLAKMAKAMGKTVSWLLYGDAPVTTLRDQPAWSAAATACSSGKTGA